MADPAHTYLGSITALRGLPLLVGGHCVCPKCVRLDEACRRSCSTPLGADCPHPRPGEFLYGWVLQTETGPVALSHMRATSAKPGTDPHHSVNCSP